MKESKMHSFVFDFMIKSYNLSEQIIYRTAGSIPEAQNRQKYVEKC